MSKQPRPLFHFTPPSNWMNDPNGLVYHHGEYHLFYQHHPRSTQWGDMHWGHAVSRDLLHWEHLPIALYPDYHGMIYSGSAITDQENTAGFGENALIAFFTYNKNYLETQNLAYSLDDGRSWTKYEHNPILMPPEGLKDFRDPKVIRYKGHWVMLVAAANAIYFYTSSNLKEWKKSGEFSHHGSAKGVWETPDLFKLAKGNECCWVLLVSVGKGGPAGGSATQYFLGGFDGQVFTSMHSADKTLWLSYGADDYAAQAWNHQPEKRRIIIGWQNNWRYANQIPAETWRGQFTLPREVSLVKTKDGLRLAQNPIRELQALRGEGHHWGEGEAAPNVNLLPQNQSGAYEIIAEFSLESDQDIFGFNIHNGAGETFVIGCDVKNKKVFIDRSKSGAVDFDIEFGNQQFSDFEFTRQKTFHLHVFVDRTSIEVFAEHGLIFFSNLFFPTENIAALNFFTAANTTAIKQLDLYTVNSATSYQDV